MKIKIILSSILMALSTIFLLTFFVDNNDSSNKNIDSINSNETPIDVRYTIQGNYDSSNPFYIDSLEIADSSDVVHEIKYELFFTNELINTEEATYVSPYNYGIGVRISSDDPTLNMLAAGHFIYVAFTNEGTSKPETTIANYNPLVDGFADTLILTQPEKYYAAEVWFDGYSGEETIHFAFLNPYTNELEYLESFNFGSEIKNLVEDIEFSNANSYFWITDENKEKISTDIVEGGKRVNFSYEISSNSSYKTNESLTSSYSFNFVYSNIDAILTKQNSQIATSYSDVILQFSFNNKYYYGNQYVDMGGYYNGTYTEWGMNTYWSVTNKSTQDDVWRSGSSDNIFSVELTGFDGNVYYAGYDDFKLDYDGSEDSENILTPSEKTEVSYSLEKTIKLPYFDPKYPEMEWYWTTQNAFLPINVTNNEEQQNPEGSYVIVWITIPIIVLSITSVLVFVKYRKKHNTYKIGEAND